jgi:mannose-6-phosphate isomerase
MALKKQLYPLKFVPILKEKVWGGSNLISKFGKELPEPGKDQKPLDASHIGESWEISGFEGDVSVVADGFLKGNDLDDVLETYLGNLEGDNVCDYYGLTFPLLIKYLDVHDRLSVQVHPDDETAMERADSLGKTEFWYVIEASDDAEVYMGFKRDVTAQEFYDRCKDGSVEGLMNVFHPKKGDCFFIKAGTIHACKGDVVIAEIQETSDMTYRVYDWGREFNPETRREMHLDQAIDCIDYLKYDEDALYLKQAAGSRNLVQCKYFTINRVELKNNYYRDPQDYNSCIIYMCISGSAMVSMGSDRKPVKLGCGESVLIPKESAVYVVSPESEGTVLLEVYIDEIPQEDDSYIDKTKAARLEGEPLDDDEDGQDGKGRIDPDDWDLSELDERILNVHLGDDEG